MTLSPSDVDAYALRDALKRLRARGFQMKRPAFNDRATVRKNVDGSITVGLKE